MFLHRLALALGRTVGELLASLSLEELRDWQTFDRQAGLPDIAAQWQRGVAVSIAAAAAGGQMDAADYVPLLSWDSQPATPQQIKEVFSRA